MTPALEAHLRLMTNLPVRTHYRREVNHCEIRNKYIGVGKGNSPHNRKKVTIEGVSYPSSRHAVRALSISNKTLYKWIFEGKAIRG